MIRRRRHIALLLILLPGPCLLNVVVAQVQPVIRFVPERASLGGSVDGSWRNSSGFISRPFNQNNYRQWVVLPFAGAFINNRIARYSFSLKPGFTQQNSTDLPDALKTRNLGYAADVSLLAAMPVSFNLHWSRDTGLQRGGFGTQGEFETSVFNPSLHLNASYLPIRVAYTRRMNQNLTQVGPGLIPIEHADAIKTFLVEARNSKLTAGYERTDFDDRIRTNDYASENIYLNHWYRWGKRSALNSRFSKTERTGTLPYMRQSWNESVRLQHSRVTYTELDYSQYKNEGLGGGSKGHSWGGGITSGIGEDLDFGGRVSNSWSTFDAGRLKAFSAGPWLGISRKLGDRVHVTGNGSVSYLNRRLENDSESAIRVINEAYTIDDTRIVVLAPLSIEPASILVQNGAQTLFLEEGLDFEVVTVGQSIELHVLPGARVESGDVVLVSYQYRPLFDAEDDGFISSFSAGINVAGIQVRHSRSHRATSQSGQGFLPASGDYNQRSTTLRTYRKTPLGYLDVDLSNRMRDSEAITYTTNEARVSLALPPWKSLRVHVNTVARMVDEGGNRVKLFAVGTTLSQTLKPDIRLNAGANYQNWEQVQQLMEQSFNAYASVDYQIGLVGVKLRYAYDRRNTTFISTGHRISLYVLRRF